MNEKEKLEEYDIVCKIQSLIKDIDNAIDNLNFIKTNLSHLYSLVQDKFYNNLPKEED